MMMQRFKQHMISTTPPHQLLFQYLAGRKPVGWPPYADKHGKFVYDSTVLCRAARRRSFEVWTIATIHLAPSVAMARHEITDAQRYRHMAKSAGFYLP